MKSLDVKSFGTYVLCCALVSANAVITVLNYLMIKKNEE